MLSHEDVFLRTKINVLGTQNSSLIMVFLSSTKHVLIPIGKALKTHFTLKNGYLDLHV